MAPSMSNLAIRVASWVLMLACFRSASSVLMPTSCSLPHAPSTPAYVLLPPRRRLVFIRIHIRILVRGSTVREAHVGMFSESVDVVCSAAGQPETLTWAGKPYLVCAEPIRWYERRQWWAEDSRAPL